MNKVALLPLLLALAGTGTAQTTAKIAGHWKGKIAIPEHELPITVDLAQNAKGVWIGSISVTGSTAVDVPMSSVTVEDAAVKFTAGLPEQASFDGRLSDDGSSLAGNAASSAGEAPFQLARDGEAKVSVPPPSSKLTKEFEGSWEATIDSGGQTRKVSIKLSPAADGTATAVLSGRQQIPVTTVTIKDKELQMEARAVSGTFHGTLGTGGEITGEWTERSNHIPLTFKRVSPDAKKP